MRTAKTVISCCLALLLLGSCTGSYLAVYQSAQTDVSRSWSSFDPLAPSRTVTPLEAALKTAPALTAKGLTIVALDADNNPDPRLQQALQVTGEWPEIEIYTTVPVSAAAIYVGYDAAANHATVLDADRPDGVSLAVEYVAGKIAIGAGGIGGAELNTSIPLATLSFAAGPSTIDRHVQRISLHQSMAVNDLEAIDNGEAAATLGWGERNTGDYDLNGEVNAADITKIAIHYQKSYTTESPDFAQLEVIDGDGNGEINTADIQPIAVNFLSTIVGYNVYRMAVDSPEDVPLPSDPGWEFVPNDANPSGPSAPRQTGSQDFRYRYTFNDDTGVGDFAWFVAPAGAAGDPPVEGPASNVVVETVTPDVAPPAGLSIEIMPPNGPLMNVDNVFYIAIRIEDVEGLFSANVRIEYDGNLVEFIEAVPDYDTNFNLLEPPLFIAADDIDPADPPYILIGFNATQIQGTPPKDGSGYLGYLKFKAIASGINDEAFRFPQSSNFILLWGEQYGVPAATPVLGSPQIVNIG